ncbi:nucleotidyl transferase AbiEii/AbiGii toxin family protein [Arcticibacter sp. MXS-1]|uniref:nucleotidyl transferase AbiEii/AbiGii toxin family protein n=1 Tax=Arcticibacter sp. MXS-1 TaxID=3341726 RepID=UPI0035A8FCC8
MLFWNTVSVNLKEVLLLLMHSPVLASFRLVGGTALSLHLGHRMSIDIDLFSDAPYGSIDFDIIEKFLKETFSHTEGDFGGASGMGKSYLIGNNETGSIKLDLYYSTDPFFQNAVTADGVRMATVDEIVAMKVDVIQRGGRKKDFWDLHEALNDYTIDEMIELHKRRFEWTHDPALIRKNFVDFSSADADFDPVCLKGKIWQFIKDDFEELV